MGIFGEILWGSLFFRVEPLDFLHLCCLFQLANSLLFDFCFFPVFVGSFMFWCVFRKRIHQSVADWIQCMRFYGIIFSPLGFFFCWQKRSLIDVTLLGKNKLCTGKNGGSAIGSNWNQCAYIAKALIDKLRFMVFGRKWEYAKKNRRYYGVVRHWSVMASIQSPQYRNKE